MATAGVLSSTDLPSDDRIEAAAVDVEVAAEVVPLLVCMTINSLAGSAPSGRTPIPAFVTDCQNLVVTASMH